MSVLLLHHEAGEESLQSSVALIHHPSVKFLARIQLPWPLCTHLSRHQHSRQWRPSRSLRHLGRPGRRGAVSVVGGTHVSRRATSRRRIQARDRLPGSPARVLPCLASVACFFWRYGEVLNIQYTSEPAEITGGAEGTTA